MSQDNIIQLDFSEEMKTSYRDYAVSVIRARALPDVRDLSLIHISEPARH